MEIITSSNLQTMRMSIRGHRIEDFNVYVFVQTHLQRGDLPPIEYVNAEERAKATVSMFRDVFMVPLEKIKVIRNANKAEILSIFNELMEDAKLY